MKIKCLIDCWTPYPEVKWYKDKVVDVSNEVGKKLLRNNNFVQVSESQVLESKKTVKRYFKGRKIIE